jgi:ferredoxin-type protein NapH
MNYPFSRETQRVKSLASRHVVAEPERCIQCGICSFNCPIDIDVRLHAWLGKPVNDPYCLTCGECVDRCPRRVLRFETTDLFDEAEL